MITFHQAVQQEGPVGFVMVLGVLLSIVIGMGIVGIIAHFVMGWYERIKNFFDTPRKVEIVKSPSKNRRMK